MRIPITPWSKYMTFLPPKGKAKKKAYIKNQYMVTVPCEHYFLGVNNQFFFMASVGEVYVTLRVQLPPETLGVQGSR